MKMAHEDFAMTWQGALFRGLIGKQDA